MTKIEQLKEQLWDLSQSDLFNVWNDFCDNNHWERVYDNSVDEIVDYYHNDLEKFLIENMSNSDYNNTDDYFTIDGYGHLKSFDDLYDEIDEDSLLDWIIENELYDTYGFEIEEEDEEDEE